MCHRFGATKKALNHLSILPQYDRCTLANARSFVRMYICARSDLGLHAPVDVQVHAYPPKWTQARNMTIMLITRIMVIISIRIAIMMLVLTPIPILILLSILLPIRIVIPVRIPILVPIVFLDGNSNTNTNKW